MNIAKNKFMKRSLVLIPFLLVFFGVICSGVGKTREASAEKNAEIFLLSEELTNIVKDGKSDYALIYSSDYFVSDQVMANEISKKINSSFGVRLPAFPDVAVSETKYEILIGSTDRAFSSEISNAFSSYSSDEWLVWCYAFSDGKLAYNANCNEAFEYGQSDFFSLIGEVEFSVPSDLFEVKVKSRSEYENELAEKAEQERLERLEFVKSEIPNFDDSLFGERTPMPDGLYNAPLAYPPVGEHPRLLLTSDMLPEIRAILEDPTYQLLARNFWEYADMNTDGKLPSPSSLGRSYNVDEDTLRAIEAKALAYLITGNELYGYEAIYAAKNYMLTLVVTHDLGEDIYGYYTRSMQVIGEVYDWCYDLMTDIDKSQFVRGVENYFLKDCSCGKTDKATIGFPPTQMNAVQGHGTAIQLQRDYLSFALAIFDEYPDWWNLVAGRYYEEFVPAGDIFFASGSYTQGTNNYIWNKIYSKLIAAWITKVATGDVAYVDGIANVAFYTMHQRLPNGKLFQSGDGTTTALGASDEIGDIIYVLAALFPSEINSINAKIFTNNYTKYSTMMQTSASSPSIFLIFKSAIPEVESGVGINDGLGLHWYAPSPMSEMTVRNSWDENAAVVFMRIGELNGDNHDHQDSGTFQIYYKGCFTSESGQYGSAKNAQYGSVHAQYWHQATVAHNGILVYNPTLADTQPIYDESGKLTNASRFYYSGSQRDPNAGSSIGAWLSGSATMAKTTGVDYYYNPLDGSIEYAYLSGDLTQAYSSEALDAIERRMLTVYTGNDEFPMFFTVYDYVKSDEASTKSFLMHTVTEPYVDGNVATCVHNDGKIVLTTLSDGAVMKKIGGVGMTYWVNEAMGNLDNDGTVSDGELWGRIQIDSTGKAEDHLLNVIYVTDADNENTLAPERFENDTVIGMKLENTIAVFNKGISKNRAALSFETSGRGLYTYYFSGLSAGSWKVSVDGVVVAHAHTEEENGLIVFKAPTGAVSLDPGIDVRPVNSDDITYVTNGLLVPDEARYFYEHDVEYVLPEPKVPEGMIFAGWYSSETSTERMYSIPIGTRGPITIYAKCYRRYSEDFEETKLNIITATKTVNEIRYSGSKKTGASFVTESEDGNTYLVWTAGENDPSIAIKNKLASIMVDKTVVTFSMDMALNGENAPIESSFRMRGPSSKNCSNVFSIDSEGKITLGYKTEYTVTTLSRDFTRITVSVDFESGIIYALGEDGFIITEMPIVLSTADTEAGMTALEYLYTLQFVFEWYAASGQDASSSLRIDNLRVELGYPENANVPDPSKPNAIIYNNLIDSTLPSQTRYTYSDTESTTLPEPKAADGYTFLGWYSEPEFLNKVTEVSIGTEGRYNVYAKWKRTIEESFDELDLNVTGVTSNMGEFGYRTKNKDGAAFTTADDGNGGKYLLIKGGIKDPQFQINGSLRNITLDKNSVTYSLKLARDGENPVPKTAFSVRESGSAQIALFTTTVDGDVLLAGKSALKITTLTDEFFELIISVDFDAATVTVYNADGSIKTDPETGTKLIATIAKPAKSTAETLVDFIDTSTLAFCWYVSSDASGGERAFRVDSIKVTGGVYCEPLEDVANEIVYSGIDGAKLPEDAPSVYDPEAETVLPIKITLDGKIFMGWYKDAAFTEKLEVIPAGQTGDYTVYARWATVVSNDFENTEIDIENPDGASYSNLNPNIDGFGYRINKKADAAFKIVTDESNNKYLLWSGGTQDPAFLGVGSLADIMGGNTAVTYSLKLSLDGEKNAIASAFRIQESGSNNISVFTVTKEGDVLLCGKSALKVCTLSSEFVKLTVEVDFAAATVIVYDEDGAIAENPDTGEELVCSISKPAKSEATDLVDFINYTANLFYWYASSNSDGVDRALRIDDIVITPGKN